MPPISGHATELGTARYRQRFPHAAADHFRQRYGLWMGSMGLGTYLGAPTDTISQAYVRSITVALAAGCNVIDTAPTYRLGRAQQDVGAGLADAIAQGIVERDEVIVCTKGGLIPDRFPGSGPDTPRPDDLAGGLHSLDPVLLAGQIDESLTALGLACVDIFYIQNPEMRLFYESPGEFMQRLRGAFEGLEKQVQAGTIRFHGVAIDDGFLVSPDAQNYLPLYKMVQVAEAVAGANHHFRFLQVPYHMGQTAALTNNNQMVKRTRKRSGKEKVERIHMSLLAAAVQYGLATVACGVLAQGTWVEERSDDLSAAWGDELSAALGHPVGNVQMAVQFARSTPGVTTALVGMGDAGHVVENMALMPVDLVAAERFFKLCG